MSIHDFHASFMSNEQTTLLGALRRLSQIEDAQAMLASDPDSSLSNWAEWNVSESLSGAARYLAADPA